MDYKFESQLKEAEVTEDSPKLSPETKELIQKFRDLEKNMEGYEGDKRTEALETLNETDEEICDRIEEDLDFEDDSNDEGEEVVEKKRVSAEQRKPVEKKKEKVVEKTLEEKVMEKVSNGVISHDDLYSFVNKNLGFKVVVGKLVFENIYMSDNYRLVGQ